TLALAALFALTTFIPPRTHVALPAAPERSTEKEPLLEADVLAAFQGDLRNEIADETSAEVEAMAERLESLLASLADGSIEKSAALDRLGEILDSLDAQQGIDLRRLDTELGKMGESLAGGGDLLQDAA